MLSSVRWHSLIILVILLIQTSTTSSEIQLEPPSFSSKYQNDIDQTVSSKALAIYPCNGTFVKTNGTTCGLKDIMIGRCYDYQFIKRNPYISSQNQTKNCTELYRLFESAVGYKPYCNMNMSTYEAFFNYALSGVHIVDRGIFWSGTYAVTHEYAMGGFNYVTLEDTLAAGMVDGLTWCGKENDPDAEGFDYVSCPGSCQDNKWADVAFWGLASTKFAELVAGQVYVILNGSRPNGRPTYSNESYFAIFELPNFQRNGTYAVTKVNVLILHTPDYPVLERCGEKSIILLEKFIRDNGFQYECVDDPDELLLVMCGDNWNARECQVARQALRKQWDLKVFGKSRAIFHSNSIFLLILSYFCCQIFFN